ncbi:hypothetical protein IscW_ISCW003021, partial [Ixodes scapularis]
ALAAGPPGRHCFCLHLFLLTPRRQSRFARANIHHSTRAPPPPLLPPLRTCRGYCGRASPLCLLMGRDKTHLKHR